MLDYIYEWIRSLAYYTILMTAIVQIIPNKGYKKYIQFYMGLIIVLMLCSPIMKILGMEEQFFTLYQSKTYELEMKELEEKSDYLREVELDAYISIEDTN
ncbi:MAG: stage III sporulation protein AF [Eubacteriales bacterium]